MQSAVTLLLTVVSAQIPIPPIPYMSEIQQKAVSTAQSLGAEAAPEARRALLTVMDDPLFKKYLRMITDSDIVNMTNEELMAAVGRQYQMAEVVHNWFPASSKPGIHDVMLNTTVPYEYFFQGWQLQAMGIYPAENLSTSVNNWAETNVFHFDQFPQEHPNFVEASTRIVYGAMNIHKSSTGNIPFGSVSSVFKNSRIYNTSTIFGVDSGMYTDACSPPSIPKFDPALHLNCSQFQPVSTFEHWEPSVLANVMLFNDTYTPGIPHSAYPQFNLAYFIGTFLNEDLTEQYPLLGSHRATDYIEVNPAINVKWSTDIKMVIFNYRENLFGSGVADILRHWAISNNWVIVWADDSYNSSNPTFTANKRFLDPVVLLNITAGTNITTDPSFPDLLSVFQSEWHVANSTANRTGGFYNASWGRSWEAFEGTILQVQPLGGLSCADPDCAVVRVVDKACVCA